MTVTIEKEVKITIDGDDVGKLLRAFAYAEKWIWLRRDSEGRVTGKGWHAPDVDDLLDMMNDSVRCRI